jgi:hypothetical protein
MNRYVIHHLLEYPLVMAMQLVDLGSVMFREAGQGVNCSMAPSGEPRDIYIWEVLLWTEDLQRIDVRLSVGWWVKERCVNRLLWYIHILQFKDYPCVE